MKNAFRCRKRMHKQNVATKLKHEIIDFDRNASKSSERPGTQYYKRNLVKQNTS